MTRYLDTLFLGLSLAAGLPGPAAAAPPGGMIGEYTARLSEQDHFNSSGVRLRTAAGIIRQDRANFYRFGSGDAEDQPDPFFASATNRARMEAMLLYGKFSASAAKRVLYGTPVIHVRIWPNYVLVTVY